MKFKQWLENLHSRTPPNMPKTQYGLIGNELKTDAGAASKDLNQKINHFNTSLVDVPTMKSLKSNQGLGDLGLIQVGKSTFKAGENPTISRGVPITDLKGQFGN
jgi:hypothetical protein